MPSGAFLGLNLRLFLSQAVTRKHACQYLTARVRPVPLVAA